MLLSKLWARWVPAWALRRRPLTPSATWPHPWARGELSPIFCYGLPDQAAASSTSLNTMASAVLFERHPFERIVLCRTVAKVLSMGLVVRRCFQCRREIVKDEQRLWIFPQALGGLVVFDSIGFDESVERRAEIGLKLSLDTAYHSFDGEVEARTPPRYAALPIHAVTNFRP